MFYEADLHTDRLSANKERSVAWNYRNLELCPARLEKTEPQHKDKNWGCCGARFLSGPARVLANLGALQRCCRASRCTRLIATPCDVKYDGG